MSDLQTHEDPGSAPHATEAENENVQGNDSKIRLAIGKNPMETGTPVLRREWSLPCLAKVLTTHKSRAEKFGPYFCAPMAGDRRNGDNALPWQLFPLDFDGKEGDRPDPEASKACFSEYWHVGYSTHSHTPENGKHRVVLLLDREIDKTEYKALFDAFDAVLPFVPDPKLNHPDQPVFLPAHPHGATPVAWVNEGKPFEVDAFLERHKCRTEAESRARKTYSPPPQNSVIGAFNAAHDLASILERHGYQRSRKRYIHPHSESGIPSVSILGDGSICMSHSSSDPLGDGKPHDAFDAFAILAHRGDKKAATKAAAELLGVTNRQGQNQDTGKAKPKPTLTFEAAGLSIDIFDEDGKKKSQATLLIELAGRFMAFHDADDNAYVCVYQEHIRQVLPVRSRAIKQRLAGDFFALTGKGCNGNAISGINYGAVNGRAVPLAGYVDAATRTINLYDIKSSGGNITLTGQILSTGAGKVLAFNGQPSLSLTNNSTWKLAPGAIDLAPINGKITIVDTPRISLVPSAIDTSANSITFTNAHNLVSGSQVIYQYNNSINSSSVVDDSSPVGGLVRDTIYFVDLVNATTIKLKAASNSTANVDISAWNVASATTMASMFNTAAAWNQSISGWNTATVKDLSKACRLALASLLRCTVPAMPSARLAPLLLWLHGARRSLPPRFGRP
jgi:hypothetical protein